MLYKYTKLNFISTRLSGPQFFYECVRLIFSLSDFVKPLNHTIFCQAPHNSSVNLNYAPIVGIFERSIIFQRIFRYFPKPSFSIPKCSTSIFHHQTFIIPFLKHISCLLYTSPSPRDKRQSRMPSSA